MSIVGGGGGLTIDMERIDMRQLPVVDPGGGIPQNYTAPTISVGSTGLQTSFME